MKKYEKFVKISSRNVENLELLLYHSSNSGHCQAPTDDKVSNMSLKASEYNLSVKVKTYA